MIVERIRNLLIDKGITAKEMLLDLNINKDALKRWEITEKSGKIIKPIYLTAVADYLDTSVDYLLGKTDDPTHSIKDIPLTNKERRVALAYREKEALQPVIDKLLDIQ